MTNAQVLDAIKIDLGITTTRYDERLLQMLEASKEAVKREGMTVSMENYEDVQILEMYTEWLWRRRDTGEGMPRMLRYALNNRIFGEHMTNG